MSRWPPARGVCAFLCDGEVLALVAVWPSGGERLADARAGRWREVLSRREIQPQEAAELSALLDEDGIELLERI